MKRNIVITGTTSGIGKELVSLLAQDKDNIIFAGYRNEKLIDNNFDNVKNFYIDLTSRKTIVEAANFIKSQTAKIDILINVAGCVVAGPIETIDTDKLREQFEVNTFSHIEFFQNLLDCLCGGRIINVSSMASFGHFPFISPYCASKRAMDIFFNAFALENHRNIKVISVKPGVIATPIWEKSVKNNSESLEKCVDYSKEMEFLKNNALKNTNKGLNVEDVAKRIIDISLSKNPRASYTIGKDAKFAQILSLLPQDVINGLVGFGLRMRIK